MRGLLTLDLPERANSQRLPQDVVTDGERGRGGGLAAAGGRGPGGGAARRHHGPEGQHSAIFSFTRKARGRWERLIQLRFNAYES